jgi:hypothetical protein
MKRREQEELIGFQLREKIEKRVSVPSRDIRQEYERFFETFNPPPRATFRLVQIPASKAEAVESFSKRLAAGESFATLASDATLNAYKPATGGLEEREIEGDRARGAFFGNEALNAAARTTAPGQVAGPIAVGDNSSWLFLESIEQKSTESVRRADGHRVGARSPPPHDRGHRPLHRDLPRAGRASPRPPT